MVKQTWYDKGFQDAVDNLPCDPPYGPRNGHHNNYLAGYKDGEVQTEVNERKSRPVDA